jgi:hypothetical protein
MKVKVKENDPCIFSWLTYSTRTVPCISCQFCNVAKVAIIHNKNLAKFGYTPPDSESQFSKKWIYNCIFLATKRIKLII